MSSFRDNLKSMFGFGADTDAEERITTKQKGHSPSYVNPFKEEEERETAALPAEASTEVDVREAIGDEIVERVTQVLEAPLPDYAKQCIDRVAQADYVRGIIGDALQKCIASIYADAEKKAQSRWNDDRAAIEHEQSETKRRCAELARKNEDLSARMMSIERQKTTLADRVSQMEQRVQTAEAEREQFHMESKSLMNKLKVAQLGAESVQSMQAELDKLRVESNEARAELLKAKQQVELAESAKERLTAAMAECTTLRAEKDAIEAKNKALSEEVEMLKAAEPKTVIDTAEIERLGGELDAMKKEMASLKAELNTSETELEASRKELSQKQAAIQSQAAEIASLKAAEPKTVIDTAEIERLSSEIDSRNKELSEMRKTIQSQNDEIYSLHERLSQSPAVTVDESAFAGLQAERDALEQKSTLLQRQLDEKETRLQDVTNSKKEIENVYNLLKKELEQSKRMYADKEQSMREEIERLSSDTESLKTTVEAQKQAAKKKDRKKKSTISAIDYGNSDYTDWLMPTPPTPSMPVEEPMDFIFEEPAAQVKAPSETVNPNMPTQTSLFGDSDD